MKRKTIFDAVIDSIYKNQNKKIERARRIKESTAAKDTPKKALMVASVASMIDLFNKDNMDLQKLLVESDNQLYKEKKIKKGQI